MNPVERLRAAIEKLEWLRDHSTPGPWAIDDNDAAIFTFGPTVAGGTIAYVNTDQRTGDRRPYGDASLIETLHRTIDAQLAILRSAVKFLGSVGHHTSSIASPFVDGALALADAILGEES